MEIWNGYRAGIDGAIEIYDADEAYAIDLWMKKLLTKLLNKERLYYRIGQNAEFDARVSQWIQKADAQQRRGSAPAEVIQLIVLLMKCA
jgi:Xaa-Pro aminopeptidase